MCLCGESRTMKTSRSYTMQPLTLALAPVRPEVLKIDSCEVRCLQSIGEKSASADDDLRKLRV